jgi:hypothetical protein
LCIAPQDSRRRFGISGRQIIADSVQIGERHKARHRSGSDGKMACDARPRVGGRSDVLTIPRGVVQTV